MSRFDRCIFISIAIGIWALAMTQVFKSEILHAGYAGVSGKVWFSSAQGRCPDHVKTYDMSSMRRETECNYLLTATFEDLKKYPGYFK